MKPPWSLLVLVLAVGCNAKAPPSPALPSAPPAPGPAAPPAIPRGAAPTGEPVPAPGSFDESILRGREFLLEVPALGTVPALDPVVGPLGTDGAIAQTLEAFFRGAQTGRLDSALLVPEWAAELSAWAARARGQGLKVEALRVGVPLDPAEGEVLVPVHLAGNGRHWKGWVALVGASGGWLVSDVQTVETPWEGPYDPEAGGQEISSPSLR